MATSGVGASSNAVDLLRQAPQTQQTRQTQNSASEKAAAEARKAEAARAQQPTQDNKPVVNAQGQKTGQLINTSA